MKIKDVIKNHYATIGIILVIMLTTALSFTNYIPQKDVMNYLLCADVGLAINVLLASLESDKRNSDIIKLLKPNSVSEKVTRELHYKLLNTAVTNAKSQICIMTIDSALNRNVVASIPERKIYYRKLEYVAKKYYTY